jgi:hypothetical protein
MSSGDNKMPNKQLQPRPRHLGQPIAEGEIVEYNSLKELITPDTPLSKCPTNLVLEDPRQAALAIAALGVADIAIDQTGRATIKATNYLIYGDYMPRQDGTGFDPVVFVALITEDGRVFRTSSVYAPRAIRGAVELYSASEWKRGITFLISERQTKDRKIAHDIRILFDAGDGTGPTV